MKLEGSHTLAAPRPRVYEFLTNPAVLARLLPGCEKFEPAGSDSFQVKMKLGLAGLSGSYEGRVQLSEARPPEHLRLGVSSRGAWGFADGEAALELTEAEGRTTVRYAGELKVGGTIAAVGQRLLESAARRVVGQFFGSLEKEVGAV